MSAFVSMTVFFLDGTKVSFRYPRQSGTDASTIASTIKRAIDADKLVLEVQGDLLVIPIKAVKYVQVSPAPDHLPAGVLRKARLLG
jgi:hypothetical protein